MVKNMLLLFNEITYFQNICQQKYGYSLSDQLCWPYSCFVLFFCHYFIKTGIYCTNILLNILFWLCSLIWLQNAFQVTNVYIIWLFMYNVVINKVKSWYESTNRCPSKHKLLASRKSCIALWVFHTWT